MEWNKAHPQSCCHEKPFIFSIPYAPHHISHYLHYTKGNLDPDIRVTSAEWLRNNSTKNNTPPETHRREICGVSYSWETFLSVNKNALGHEAFIFFSSYLCENRNLVMHRLKELISFCLYHGGYSVKYFLFIYTFNNSRQCHQCTFYSFSSYIIQENAI